MEGRHLVGIVKFRGKLGAETDGVLPGPPLLVTETVEPCDGFENKEGDCMERDRIGALTMAF